MTGFDVSLTAGIGRVAIAFADIVWTGLDAGDIRGCWIFKYVSTDSNSPLRYFQAFSRSSNGGDFRLRVPTAGAVWVVEG